MRKRQFCEERKRIVYTVGKTTYCKLDCDVDLCPEDDRNIPDSLMMNITRKYKVLKHLFGSVFTVHIEAKATCRDGDTFDEKKGKTIAYSKAQHKLYDLMRRVFGDMEYFYLRQMEDNRDIFAMFQKYWLRESKFLQQL